MENDYENDGNYEDEETKTSSYGPKKGNILPLWGNERTMNLNALILTNIQSSHYFKVNLYELKTYHEVIDEIYYKVNHLEPWEKGSRKTAGQTGMCGGVRGVGAGGIVSTAYCLLYKLFTLKLTRKQVNGLITHPDTPYIRALGFMYIRYTQPPADLWDWYDAYLEDSEEVDVKAGGGQVMTIGNILKNFLCKLEWFSTLFPRIPVPIQQKLERMMNERFPPPAVVVGKPALPPGRQIADPEPEKDKKHGDLDSDRRVFSRKPDDRRGLSKDSDHDKRLQSKERDIDRRDRDKGKQGQSRDREMYSRDVDRRGYSADRDKDKQRERDRDLRDKKDKEHDREKWDRDREHDRDRRDRDNDREKKDRERDYVKDRREKDNARDRDSVRDRDSIRDRDRDRDSVRDRDNFRDKRDRSRRDSQFRRRDEHDDRCRNDRDRHRNRH